MDASATCQALLQATSKTLVWEWDGRFRCTVAPFQAEQADEVRAAIGGATTEQWTAETIASAPERVQQLASRLGLRQGQLLYTSDATIPAMAYAAWWPWGGGLKISVRFGIDGASDTVLQAWFCLS
jgi:hypothetical protein